ncbi:MAG: hypothetical protein DRN05_06125 [Thermoplasmata archaeon]|nr:MAG: hypothetical protein DRN05_06125 [Thermoplasmata archaeon]
MKERLFVPNLQKLLCYIPFLVYIKHEFIKPDLLEYREYQKRIADSAVRINTLVVLPTGLGKTVIALLVIAEKLKTDEGKILFLAPTKPLVNQHAHFLKKFLLIDERSIAVFTGETPPLRRREIWMDSRIIVSTPQVVENDVVSRRVDLRDVCLIIFDEVHRAVGNYSYVFISEMYRQQRGDRLVLGMTASPGRDLTRILEVCRNLDVGNIEIRTKYDPDVIPYVHDLKIVWKEVPLPREFAYTIQLLRKALSERLNVLKELGMIESSSVSLINRRRLLDAQKKIQEEIRSSIKPSNTLFRAASAQNAALKIYHAIELLQTQGVNALRNYFQRLENEASSRGGSKASRDLVRDSNVLEAMAYIKSLDIEHPKSEEITRIVKEQIETKRDSKIIVFTHYRDTSAYVAENLKKTDALIRPVRFIGQAARGEDKGLTQREQIEIIKKFEKGEFNVLIATSVAEEGLDIPSTDLVVFYEPIPSEIRTIQRRGRTGRGMPGKVVILITKGTPDEGYYWAARHKEKQMRKELEVLRSHLKKELEKPHSISHIYKTKRGYSQKTLRDYQDKKISVVVDHRENRSPVIRYLSSKNVFIESQQLDAGDYVVSSKIGVERKKVEDFLESLIDGKLFQQIKKLRDAYSRPVLIIEGEGLLTKRNIDSNAVFGGIVSIISDFGVPIITTHDSRETADFLYIMASREQRENKREVAIRGRKWSMSLRERQQFIIEGLPNISAVLAKRLLSHFGSIRAIMNASEEQLCEVHGIGKNIASEIVKLLNTPYPEK